MVYKNLKIIQKYYDHFAIQYDVKQWQFWDEQYPLT